MDETGVELSDGRRIDAETLIWTAGVAANPLVAELGIAELSSIENRTWQPAERPAP